MKAVTMVAGASLPELAAVTGRMPWPAAVACAIFVPFLVWVSDRVRERHQHEEVMAIVQKADDHSISGIAAAVAAVRAPGARRH